MRLCGTGGPLLFTIDGAAGHRRPLVGHRTVQLVVEAGDFGFMALGLLDEAIRTQPVLFGYLRMIFGRAGVVGERLEIAHLNRSLSAFHRSGNADHQGKAQSTRKNPTHCACHGVFVSPLSLLKPGEAHLQHPQNFGSVRFSS